MVFDLVVMACGLQTMSYQHSSRWSFVYHDWLKPILSDRKSRGIFWFALINVSFASTEVMTGWYHNSLSLMSDGCHMFLDTSVLLMNLFITVIASWPSSPKFPLGYDRVEVMASLLNCFLLGTLCLSILGQAVQRWFYPEVIETNSVLLVAILGFFLNLYGVFCFSHHHHHHHHSHHHSHGHHEKKDSFLDNIEDGWSVTIPMQSISCSKGTVSDCKHPHHTTSLLMDGMYLHVLADLLGSLAVIISTFCIHLTGLTWIDPLCSVLLSMILLYNMISLFKSTWNMALLVCPMEIRERIFTDLATFLVSHKPEHRYTIDRIFICTFSSNTGCIGHVSIRDNTSLSSEDTRAILYNRSIETQAKKIIHQIAKDFGYKFPILSVEIIS